MKTGQRILGVMLTLAMIMPFCGFIQIRADDKIPIDNVHFPDAAFRQYIVSRGFDKNGDNSLSREELAEVKEIYCQGRGISSLQGIEYFTSLEQLTCSENKLESLDVSRNTKLTQLRCFRNELTALDVSRNTALRVLYCHWNALRSLTFGRNTALEDIECDHNRLSSLNLHELKSLKNLVCTDNRLYSLDVSNNAELEFLGCSENRLTSLDVYGLKNLNSVSCNDNALNYMRTGNNPSLNRMICSNNQLTYLSVSSDTPLEWLECFNNNLNDLDIRGLNNLYALDCSRNSLTSLNVRGMKKLRELYCYGNQLASLDLSTTDLIREIVLGKVYTLRTEYDCEFKYYGNNLAVAELKVDFGPELITEGKHDPAACKVFGFCKYGGKRYWFEDGIRQGVQGDPKNIWDGIFKIERGREIYDPESNGWYWLDAVYEGAAAEGKEVWMPYIYQDEDSWTDDEIRRVAGAADEGMRDLTYQYMKNKNGKWVRYDEQGRMLKGWVTITGSLAEMYPDQKGNTYYYDTMTGLMAKGSIVIEGKTYRFDEVTGALIN